MNPRQTRLFGLALIAWGCWASGVVGAAEPANAADAERRLSLVRQMYREMPPLVLGIREPISVREGYTFEDGGSTILVIADAQGLQCVFHLDRRIQSPTRETLFVSVEERPQVRTRDRPRGNAVLPRGAEEAALYGLLLRWERPVNLAEETRIAVDVMLDLLDARFSARP